LGRRDRNNRPILGLPDLMDSVAFFFLANPMLHTGRPHIPTQARVWDVPLVAVGRKDTAGGRGTSSTSPKTGTAQLVMASPAEVRPRPCWRRGRCGWS
jgi:hypothetical protein